jgi:hypothetical protein
VVLVPSITIAFFSPLTRTLPEPLTVKPLPAEPVPVVLIVAVEPFKVAWTPTAVSIIALISAAVIEKDPVTGDKVTLVPSIFLVSWANS